MRRSRIQYLLSDIKLSAQNRLVKNNCLAGTFGISLGAEEMIGFHESHGWYF